MESNAFTGPLTLEELKKFLAIEKSTEEINKRATIEVSQPSRTIYDESPETDFLLRMLLHDKDSDQSDDRIIEYFKSTSPRRSSDHEESTDFIQQLTDVLHLNDNEGDVKVQQHSLYDDSLIVVSDDEKSSDMNFPTDDDCQLLNIVKHEVDDTSKDQDIEVICIDTDDEDKENVFEKSTCSSTSPRKSCENEENKSKENNFNDTLEEIEMVLKYGLDYSLTNEHTAESGDKNLSFSPPSENNKTVQMSRLPIRVTKESGSSNLKDSSKEFQFKQPTLKTKTSAYKNVVSPVAVYIKNSPRHPIIRNVAVTNKKILFDNQENIASPKCLTETGLPDVVYKPPRRVVTTTKSPLKLPSNIKKLLPPVSNLIKHQGRVTKKKVSEVETKLLSNDLSTVDSSKLDSTVPSEEISIYYSQELYIS